MIQIGDKSFREKNDYLTIPRVQITNTLRKDLKDEMFKLSKDIDVPFSKILDCLILTMKSDSAITDKFVDILLKY